MICQYRTMAALWTHKTFGA